MKNELYQSCTLCPRECHADRLSGKKGACGENSVLRVGRAALHMWEEPCISGTRGSGTVFFSGCSLGCIFCQNRELSYGGLGKEISEERLAEIFLELQEKGTVCDLDNIQKDIEERDQRDMNREISPLRQAEDAVLVDSSDLTIEQVVDRILESFRARTEEGASHES